MTDVPKSPCHICGQSSFSWGTLEGSQRHTFKPDERPTLDKLMNSRGYAVRARMCIECGNIQLFIRE